MNKSYLNTLFFLSVTGTAFSFATVHAEGRSEFTGSATGIYTGYNKSQPNNDQHVFEGKLDLEWLYQFSNDWQITAKPLLRADSDDKVESEARFNEKGLQRPAATFSEATLSYYGNQSEFIIGKQIFSWGNSDLYNPGDNLNPRDVLDPINPEKLGSPSISARYLGNSFSLQAVVMPDFTPARIPMVGDRWALGTATLLAEATTIPGITGLAFTPRVLPDESNDYQYGLQFTRRNILPNTDIEISWFHGNDTYGVYTATLAPPNLRLTQVFPEYDELSISAVTTVSDLVLYGTASYHDTKKQTLADDYVSYDIGGRYTFSELQETVPFSEIQLVLEYAGEHTTKDKTSVTNIDTGYERVLTDSILGKITLKHSEFTSVELGVVYQLGDHDGLVPVKLIHKPSDELELSASVDILFGDPGTFFGDYSNNDRIRLEAEYFF